ncbi:MAG: glycerophosphodiester phosphodiesterase, partial [Acidimicrobiia bacterium]
MNPWFTRRPLHFAHQGGAREAPSNTMYAYKTAISKGADALEMDLHATTDGELVVMHDPTVDRTTNGKGWIEAMTLQEIRSLDAGYWWSPGHVTLPDGPEDAYVFRGVAGEEKSPPGGFARDDFKVPTLREVLEEFPGVYINLDIKRGAPETEPYEKEVADLLEEFGRTDDVIVASFSDSVLKKFRELAPNVTTSATPAETAAFWASNIEEFQSATVEFVALQVPSEYEGIRVVDERFLEKSNAKDIAVHV